MSKVIEIERPSKTIHRIPSGAMPGDLNIELFADRKNQKVFFMHNGKTFPFHELSARARGRLLQQLLSDEVAKKDLAHLGVNKALERFAYCVYGTLDHRPDIDHTGMINGSDNFICQISGCNCLNWQSKQITYNGQAIKGKLLEVLLAYRKGHDDINVADRLNIAAPTLNTHKKKLFQIFGVYSKSEMIVAAIEAKIIQ